MFSQLWGWIAAAFAALVAVMLFVVGQRDRAREKVEEAKGKAKAQSAARETEQGISEARQEAREHTSEVQHEDDERPSGKRPSGNLRR